jgi:hypothetical protein
MSLAGVYEGRIVTVGDGNATAFVPQIFGDTTIVISNFLSDPALVQPGKGLVSFLAGDPEHPVWVGLGNLEGRVAALEGEADYVYNNYIWKYSNAAPPAGVGEIRFNNTDLSLATSVDFRLIDWDGGDRTPVFAQLTPGTKIRVNAFADANILHRFTVNAVPTISATNAVISVTWDSGDGTLPTAGQAKTNVGFLVLLSGDPGGGGSIPGPSGGGSGNLDGGTATSIYGGIYPFDAGGAT